MVFRQNKYCGLMSVLGGVAPHHFSKDGGLSLVLVVGAGKGTQMERCLLGSTAVREYGVPEAL